jgi:peroxiredoxin
MRRILLVIPVSAALIIALVIFKMTRKYDPVPAGSTGDVRPAPLFQLPDEHSRTVRLASYVGRQKLLIVFFDGSRGPEQSQLLQQLRNAFPMLDATGATVFAISAARPSQNRYGANLEHLKIDPAQGGTPAADEMRYSFRLLSDIVDYQWHRNYGAFDATTAQPREAVYIVDRAGLIQREHLGPAELGAPEDWVRELKEVR